MHFRPFPQGLYLVWSNKLFFLGTHIFRFKLSGLIFPFCSRILYLFLVKPSFLLFNIYFHQGYFTDVSEFLRIGSPLYFVVKDYNYSYQSEYYVIPLFLSLIPYFPLFKSISSKPMSLVDCSQYDF